MVKKLFKHELSAYWRVLIPVWIILMGVAALGRLVQVFEQDNTIYGLINGSAITMYVVALVAALAFPLVYAVIRYYTNFFTGEGYLTFTLPTTPARLLIVKVLTAGLMEVLTVLVAVSSLTVITAGDVLIELWKAGVYLLKVMYAELGNHLIFFGIEFVLALLASLLYIISFYELCINIGQLFPKLRILAAVGVYFAFYVVEQIIGTIVLIVVSVVNMESLMVFISENPYLFVHSALCGGAVFTLVLTAAFFAISHYIISKRLNLE